MNRREWLRRVGASFAVLILILLMVWARAALYCDLPLTSARKPVGAIYVFGISSGVLFYHRFAFLIALAGFVLVLIW
jgi:hypothetical protein